MPIVKIVSVPISVSGSKEAELAIGQVRAAAKNLSDANPTIKIKVDAAAAILSARIARAGITAELSKGLGGGGGGGLLARLGLGAALTAASSGGIGAGIPVIGSAVSQLTGLMGGAAGGAVGFAGIAGVVNLIGGMVQSLAAAGGAVTAFGALAVPTFSAISTGVTAVDAATTKVARNAAWASIPKSLQPVVHQVIGVQSAFDSLAQKLQPVVLSIAKVGLSIAQKLLPTLLPFAKAAGGAILTLLQGFEKFSTSPGFKAFEAEMLRLSGPAILAIGGSLGKLAVAAGKLLASFSGHVGLKALTSIIDAVALATTAIAYAVRHWNANFGQAVGAFSRMWQNMRLWAAEGALFIVKSFQYLADGVLGFIGRIVDGAAKAFGGLPLGIGSAFKKAAASFDAFRKTADSNMSSVEASLQGYINALQGIPKVITTVIQTVHIGGPQPLPGVPHRASGGWTSGLALVGERGPELIQAPQGSYVYSSQASRQMLGGMSSAQADAIIGLLGAVVGRLDDGNSIAASAPAATGATFGAVLNGTSRAAGYAAMYPNRTGGSR